MSDMARQIAEFGRDHGLIHEAVVTGRKVRAGREFWAKLAHDEDLFRRVLVFVGSDGFEPTASQRSAREIMGYNFFGVEKAVAHFGVDPAPEQLTMLAKVPFTEAVLKKLKDTHILVAVFPLSIIEIHDKVGLLSRQPWWDNEPFAGERIVTSWQLVRKTEVANSKLKTWQRQQALIGKNEQVPTAQIMVYTIIGHYLATGERLFKHVCVRTSSVCFGHDRICVGDLLDPDGLSVRPTYGNSPWEGVGVSSVQKP